MPGKSVCHMHTAAQPVPELTNSHFILHLTSTRTCCICCSKFWTISSESFSSCSLMLSSILWREQTRITCVSMLTLDDHRSLPLFSSKMTADAYTHSEKQKQHTACPPVLPALLGPAAAHSYKHAHTHIFAHTHRLTNTLTACPPVPPVLLVPAAAHSVAVPALVVAGLGLHSPWPPGWLAPSDLGSSPVCMKRMRAICMDKDNMY